MELFNDIGICVHVMAIDDYCAIYMYSIEYHNIIDNIVSEYTKVKSEDDIFFCQKIDKKSLPDVVKISKNFIKQNKNFIKQNNNFKTYNLENFFKNIESNNSKICYDFSQLFNKENPSIKGLEKKKLKNYIIKNDDYCKNEFLKCKQWILNVYNNMITVSDSKTKIDNLTSALKRLEIVSIFWNDINYKIELNIDIFQFTIFNTISKTVHVSSPSIPLIIISDDKSCKEQQEITNLINIIYNHLNHKITTYNKDNKKTFIKLFEKLIEDVFLYDMITFFEQ